MILKGYTIKPELLKAFESWCGPGHCEELAAMISNKLHPLMVISRMEEIANCEDSINTWQKTQKGSFDNLTCEIGRFEYNLDKYGGFRLFRIYERIDKRVWIDGQVPYQSEWDRMTGVAEVLIDHNGCWEGRIRPEHSSRQSPAPKQEIWTQMLKGNLLYPRRDQEGEWDYVISEAADTNELEPLVAAKASGSSLFPLPEDEISVDRHPSGPRMPPISPLPCRDRYDSRSRSPSTESERRSHQFEIMPAQRSSRQPRQPRSRSLSPELRSWRFEEDKGGGHGHSKDHAQPRHPSQSSEPSSRGSHHDGKSAEFSSKSSQKKGKMYLWRKRGEIRLARSKK